VAGHPQGAADSGPRARRRPPRVALAAKMPGASIGNSTGGDAGKSQGQANEASALAGSPRSWASTCPGSRRDMALGRGSRKRSTRRASSPPKWAFRARRTSSSATGIIPGAPEKPGRGCSAKGTVDDVRRTAAKVLLRRMRAPCKFASCTTWRARPFRGRGERKLVPGGHGLKMFAASRAFARSNRQSLATSVANFFRPNGRCPSRSSCSMERISISWVWRERRRSMGRRRSTDVQAAHAKARAAQGGWD